jgi:hypothetical protein
MRVVGLVDSCEVPPRLTARIIVMPGRSDVSPILRRLDESGIPASIVPAVVGQALPSEALAQVLDESALRLQLGYAPTAPMVGCWMSHRQCYALLAEDLQDFDLLLVLEDDVELPDDFTIDPAWLRPLSTDKPGILHLYTRGVAVAARSGQKKIGSRTFFRYMVPPGQTAAYIINRAAATRALEGLKMDGPADWPMWSADVDFWGVFPWLVREREIPSTIGVVEGGRAASWIRVVSVLFGFAFLGHRSLVRKNPRVALYLWAKMFISVVMRLRRRFGWRGPEHVGPLLLRRSYRT